MSKTLKNVEKQLQTKNFRKQAEAWSNYKNSVTSVSYSKLLLRQSSCWLILTEIDDMFVDLYNELRKHSEFKLMTDLLVMEMPKLFSLKSGIGRAVYSSTKVNQSTGTAVKDTSKIESSDDIITLVNPLDMFMAIAFRGKLAEILFDMTSSVGPKLKVILTDVSRKTICIEELIQYFGKSPSYLSNPLLHL